VNAQRGGAVAHVLFAWAFRVAVFAVFAPVALRYLMRGLWFECGLALLLAFYLGALLSPTD
jgi:NhaP-type Na+/H+ or K+/H+ antiporter